MTQNENTEIVRLQRERDHWRRIAQSRGRYVDAIYTEKDIQDVRFQTANRINSYFQEHMIPYFAAAQDITTILAAVDTLGSLTANPNAREQIRAAMVGLDEKFSASFTALLRIARDAEFDHDFEVISRLTALRIEGIQRFVTGQDDGEFLRHVLEDTGGTKIKEMLLEQTQVDYGGRPARMTGWRRWLARKALNLRDVHPNSTYHDLGRRIKAELQEQANAGDLSTYESEVLARMLRAKKPGALSRFVKSAVREFEGRK